MRGVVEYAGKTEEAQVRRSQYAGLPLDRESRGVGTFGVERSRLAISASFARGKRSAPCGRMPPAPRIETHDKLRAGRDEPLLVIPSSWA
jgi:hypothetical protein